MILHRLRSFAEYQLHAIRGEERLRAEMTALAGRSPPDVEAFTRRGFRNTMGSKFSG